LKAINTVGTLGETLGILEVYMGSNIYPLFAFLASDPAGLLFTIPEISIDKLHPLHNVL